MMWFGNLGRLSQTHPIIIAKIRHWSVQINDFNIIRQVVFKAGKKPMFLGFFLGALHTLMYKDIFPGLHMTEFNRTFFSNYICIQLGIAFMSAGPRFLIPPIFAFFLAEHHMIIWNKDVYKHYRDFTNGNGINIGDFTPEERRLLEYFYYF